MARSTLSSGPPAESAVGHPPRSERRGRRRLLASAQLPRELVEALLSDEVSNPLERPLRGAPVPGAEARPDLALIHSPAGPLVAKRVIKSGLRRMRAHWPFPSGGGRAGHAFRLGRAMLEAGVSTPEPLAWLRASNTTDLLVLRFVLGRGLFDSPGPATWEALARGIARMHLAGFRHRDLKAPNIIMQGDARRPTAWLLDLDGARRSACPPRRRVMVRDGGRAAASFLSDAAAARGVGEDDARHFAALLRERVGLPSTDTAFVEEVLAWARAKRARNLGVGLPFA